MKPEKKNISMVDSFFAIFGLYRIPKETVVVKKARKPRTIKPRPAVSARIGEPDTDPLT